MNELNEIKRITDKFLAKADAFANAKKQTYLDARYELISEILHLYDKDIDGDDVNAFVCEYGQALDILLATFTTKTIGE